MSLNSDVVAILVRISLYNELPSIKSLNRVWEKPDSQEFWRSPNLP